MIITCFKAIITKASENIGTCCRDASSCMSGVYQNNSLEEKKKKLKISSGGSGETQNLQNTTTHLVSDEKIFRFF